MNYNYLEAVKADVKEYINNNITLADFADRDELEEQLNNNLWTADEVTGNASGSYTFNREQAKAYVLEGIEELLEVISNFGITAQEVGERFLNQEWEDLDITIRCGLLGQAINAVLDDMDSDNELVFE